MEHWRSVLPPDRFTEVRYERLIENREAETRRLIAFTGLDWDDACLAPEINDRAVSQDRQRLSGAPADLFRAPSNAGADMSRGSGLCVSSCRTSRATRRRTLWPHWRRRTRSLAFPPRTAKNPEAAVGIPLDHLLH